MRRRCLLLLLFLGIGTVFFTFRSPSHTAPTVPALSLHRSNPAPVQSEASAPGKTAALAQRPNPVEPVALAYPDTANITEPEFIAFNRWAEAYLNAPPAARPAMEEEGIRLASRRRNEMEDLIQSHPRRALELAFPRVQRRMLPLPVRDLLEVPVSGRGDLMVVAATPAPGQSVKPLWRTAHLDGEVYQAHVYGRRTEESSRLKIVLHGVAIGQHMAVEEQPVRVLGPDEVAEFKRSLPKAAPLACAYLGDPASGDVTYLEGDAEIVPVCSGDHTEQYIEQLVTSEADNGFLGAASAETAPSTYTEGIKSVIVIRCDFSDLSGEPFSLAAATNLVDGLDNFFREMSYNKTGWHPIRGASDVTPTFRMPRTASWYGQNDASNLRNDARAAAEAAGYVLSRYQFDLVCFGNVPGFNWAGLGYVGAPGSWIRGGASLGVSAHELGHNLGLNHANFWDTGGASIMGAGSEEEYGDKFDTMGSASAGSKHFNARYKNFLNWLTASDIRAVSLSGTYRLNPHDSMSATGVRALRTAKNSITNYWLEYRASYAGNKWMPEGLGIRWARSGNQSSVLLDLTPGSPDGKDDAQLPIGRTFSDHAAGVHITPVGKAGTTPESLDVVINRGASIGNLPPQILLQASATNPPINAPVEFNVTAVDPNADELAYFWEFGDGSFSTNRSTMIKRWSSSGEFSVRCTVSDMKGKETIASMLVRVGNPASYRIAGRVFKGTQPLSGVKVWASSTRVTYTDSEGRYFLPGLPAGSYTLQASLDGYVFTRSGFVNPVRVPANQDSADFFALAANSQTTTPLVAPGTSWRYLDNGSNQGSVWRTLTFTDTAWKLGIAPLGYGDDERTVVGYGPDSQNKFITTYFRRAFSVQDPSSVIGLSLRLRRDDGAVVYLNGSEVYRNNMPTGAILHTTQALDAVGGADEDLFLTADVDPSRLRAGQNLVAVELHQANGSSSDTVFDLALDAITSAELPAPTLAFELASAFSVRVKWPDTVLQWRLESATTLEGATSWQPAGTTPQLVNGQRIVNLPLTGTRQFFRLTRE